MGNLATNANHDLSMSELQSDYPRRLFKAIAEGDALVVRTIMDTLTIDLADLPVLEEIEIPVYGCMCVLGEEAVSLSSLCVDGRPALVEGAFLGLEEVVNVLLQYGLDVDAVDRSSRGFNRTALHWASFWGHANVVDMLLSAGASQLIRDVNGQTPHLLACRNGNFGAIACGLWYRATEDRCRNSFDCSVSSQPGFGAIDWSRELANNFIQQWTKVSSALEPEKALRWEVGLDQILVIPAAELMKCDTFPSFSECCRRRIHCHATKVSSTAKLLFVSHCWLGADHPDPSSIHLEVLKKFLQEQEETQESFKYVWIDFCCVDDKQSVSREGPHPEIHNISAVVFLASGCLVLPKMQVGLKCNATTFQQMASLKVYPHSEDKNMDKTHIIQVSNLQGYLRRAWCMAEFLLSMVSGSTMYLWYHIGGHDHVCKIISEWKRQDSLGSHGCETPLFDCSKIPSNVGLHSASTEAWEKLKKEYSSLEKFTQQLELVVRRLWFIESDLNPSAFFKNFFTYVFSQDSDTWKTVLLGKDSPKKSDKGSLFYFGQVSKREDRNKIFMVLCTAILFIANRFNGMRTIQHGKQIRVADNDIDVLESSPKLHWCSSEQRG